MGMCGGHAGRCRDILHVCWSKCLLNYNINPDSTQIMYALYSLLFYGSIAQLISTK